MNHLASLLLTLFKPSPSATQKAHPINPRTAGISISFLHWRVLACHLHLFSVSQSILIPPLPLLLFVWFLSLWFYLLIFLFLFSLSLCSYLFISLFIYLCMHVLFGPMYLSQPHISLSLFLSHNLYVNIYPVFLLISLSLPLFHTEKPNHEFILWSVSILVVLFICNVCFSIDPLNNNTFAL